MEVAYASPPADWQRLHAHRSHVLTRVLKTERSSATDQTSEEIRALGCSRLGEVALRQWH